MNNYWQHWWQNESPRLRWRSGVLAIAGLLCLGALLWLHPNWQSLWLSTLATGIAIWGQFAIARIKGAPTEEYPPNSIWLLNFMLITVLHGALWGTNMLQVLQFFAGGALLAIMAVVASWALLPYPPAAITFISAILLPPMAMSGMGQISGDLPPMTSAALFLCCMLYIISSFCYKLQQNATQAYQQLEKLDEANRDLHLENKESHIKAQELTAMSMKDPLTGIANRRHMDDFITREWRRARRSQAHLSVLFLDIDNFKLYNDSEGHAAGDNALQQVAKTLKKIGRRGGDLAARYGGEEFIMIMAETNLEQASVVAERIRRNISDLNIPHPESPPYNRITVSVGLSSAIPSDGNSIGQLIESADQALYKAKKHGKNCVVQA